MFAYRVASEQLSAPCASVSEGLSKFGCQTLPPFCASVPVVEPGYATLREQVLPDLSLAACSGYDADYHHYMDKAQHAAWGRSDSKEHFPWGDEDFFQVH